jgi:hypothetical protein
MPEKKKEIKELQKRAMLGNEHIFNAQSANVTV